MGLYQPKRIICVREVNLHNSCHLITSAPFRAWCCKVHCMGFGDTQYLVRLSTEPCYTELILAEIVSFPWLFYSCFIFVHLWGGFSLSCASGAIPLVSLALVSACRLGLARCQPSLFHTSFSWRWPAWGLRSLWAQHESSAPAWHCQRAGAGTGGGCCAGRSLAFSLSCCLSLWWGAHCATTLEDKRVNRIFSPLRVLNFSLSPFLQSKNQPHRRGEYNVYSTFQSHEPEFDYLKSLEIEEKINKIRWLPQQNAAYFLLSTNGMWPWPWLPSPGEAEGASL